MENQEIRRRARKLYARNVVAAILLAWLYNGLSPVVAAVTNGLFGAGNPAGLIAQIVCMLALAPLCMGALACALQLFEDERVTYSQLIQFYRRGQWISAIGLYLLIMAGSLGGLLAIMVTSMLIFRSGFAILALLAGMVLWFWLMLRIALAPLLLITGECHTATESLVEAFGRMRGNVLDYILFSISIEWIPVGIQLASRLLEALDSAWAGTAAIFSGVISFFFAPYIMLAGTGWLVQLIRRRMQENDPPENPLLHQIGRDLPGPDPLGSIVQEGD